MQATIRRPATQDELDRLFRLRAEVFFGEGVLKNGAQPILTDELDRSPAATNLIAITPENDIIGGVRLALPQGDWVPTNTAYFDFRPLLPDQGRTASCGSMLWVGPEHRRSRLATILTRSIVALSAISGMSHFCVAAHPQVAAFLTKEGWEIVADEFFHPVEQVPVVPLIIDLADRVCDAEFLAAGQTEIRVDGQAISLEGSGDSAPIIG